MILEAINRQKRYFDPKSKKDMNEVKYYFQNNAWQTPCPFILEYPYLSIPDMIKDKMVKSFLKV